MQHKLLTEEKAIIAWLQKYEIKNYTLFSHAQYGFVVSVEGHVELSGQNLEYISVKFDYVTGDFNCELNQLKSLIGAPHTVLGCFRCYRNQLTNLIGCPQKILGRLWCSDNLLTSLEGCPETLDGSLIAYKNPMQHIVAGPKIIKGFCVLSECNLTSLKGCPQEIHGSFDCSNNNLENLCIEDFPHFIGDYIDFTNNKKLGDFVNIENFEEIQRILEKQNLNTLLDTQAREKSIHKI